MSIPASNGTIYGEYDSGSTWANFWSTPTIGAIPLVDDVTIQFVAYPLAGNNATNAQDQISNFNVSAV